MSMQHGKGASNGVEGLFKREAARSSLLLKPSDAILSVDTLMKWSQNHLTSISVFYYSKQMHEKEERFLKKRFSEAPPVPQILKNHSFIVQENQQLLIKIYSNSPNGNVLSY